MKFAFLLLALPSLANASVTLSASQTTLKTCIVSQVSEAFKTSRVQVGEVEAFAQFPAWAQAKVTVQGEPYTVLMQTEDLFGWSNVLIEGKPAITAASISSAVLRDGKIGKDVIALDLANCAD